MAKFIRHVGKHGDRKVAVIFREIPNETHMCLVVYTELLNKNIHDPLMVAIESPQGQNAKNLADELNRVYTRDGKIILQVLHHEGMMKKIQTSQVVMTPAPGQQIRLNELNSILDEMEKGEAAVQRLAEIDSSRGLQDPRDVAKRMRGEKTVELPPSKSSKSAGALDNTDLASNLRSQAARMSAEAKGLMSESERLMKEAAQLEGVLQESAKPKKERVKKVKTLPIEVIEVVTTAPVKKTSRAKKTIAG